jgi:hypothetical protein
LAFILKNFAFGYQSCADAQRQAVSHPPWQPTSIKRFIKAFPTSTCTVLVETDAGKGYLKALGNNEGPHALVCELVGTRLARWFGLPTFDFALIEITENDEIPFHSGGSALRGPAFITREESGETWSGDKRQLSLLSNQQDVSRLVVFDTWTLNCDRYSMPENGFVPRINRNNVFLSQETVAGELLLKAMDNTHCFTCGRELNSTLGNIDKIRNNQVFGNFPEFRDFLTKTNVRAATADLRKIDKDAVSELVANIPEKWEFRVDARNALRDLIVGWAKYVAETIEDKIWPRELDFGEPTGANQ